MVSVLPQHKVPKRDIFYGHCSANDSQTTQRKGQNFKQSSVLGSTIYTYICACGPELEVVDNRHKCTGLCFLFIL